jgi:hypothetical protein
MGNRLCVTGASVIAQLDVDGNKPKVESLISRTIIIEY